MAYENITLTCKDCGKPFDFTPEEQEFYASKGFTNQPVRCADCRRAKKARMEGRGFNGGDRQMFDIVCSNCGKNDKVPFQPRGDRPVLCSDCFRKQREQAA